MSVNHRLVRTSVVLASLAIASVALANGVVSEFAAGGLVFKKADTIGIASEELYLSPSEVRVSYVYNSTAPATQTVTISFPMPEVPIDDGPDNIVFSHEKLADPRNYTNFKVTVNGRPVTAQLHERALLQGRDVTAALKAAGIPLIYFINDQGSEALAKLSAQARDDLVRVGLFEKIAGDPPSYAPQWRYQTVFQWEQNFAPGNTKVDISYIPLTGTPTDYGDHYEKGKGARDYCVDNVLKAALQRRRGVGEALSLGYVLKTAQFWKGPIGRFRLVVDKEKATTLVAFCPLNSKKVSDTRFEWTATNFVPKDDIKVIFFPAPEN